MKCDRVLERESRLFEPASWGNPAYRRALTRIVPHCLPILPLALASVDAAHAADTANATPPPDNVTTPAVTDNADAPRPLRVAIAAVALFVLPGAPTPEGFSIDIWSEIARRMHVDLVWKRYAM